jgi:hypothetical protein
MLKRFIHFLFHGCGWSVENRIYYYEGKPYMGYILCYDYVMFGIPTYDRVAACHDKEALQRELDIRGIVLG